MTIQDLGSLGELIAAIATVGTLGYLAVQIRQNTRSVRASSRLAMSQGYLEHSRLRLDPAVNRAYLKGLRAYPDLPYEERSIFLNVLSDHCVFFQGTFALHEEGQLDRATYEGYLTWLAGNLATPGGARAWEEFRALYLPSVAVAVDERLRRGDLPDVLQLFSQSLDPEDQPSR